MTTVTAAEKGGGAMQWQPYTLAPLAGIVVSALIGIQAWRRRTSTPAATALSVVMLGLVAWAGEDAIGSMVTDLNVKTALALTRFPGTSAAALGLCWLCLSLRDRDFRLSRRMVLLLLVEPVAMTLLAATNVRHHLVFTATEVAGGTGFLRIHVGPLFYVHSAYNYLFILAAVVAVVRSWRATSVLHRRQLSMVLGAAAFPLAGNAVTVVQFASGGGGDFAVLGFVLTGLCCGWAVFRQGMLRLVPVARGLVLERVSDVVVVIDMAGRVLDLNPAAVRLVRRMKPDLPEQLIGLPAHRLLRGGAEAGPLTDGEYSLEMDGEAIDLDVRSSALTDRRGVPIGRVVVARDVTELNDQKRALQVAITERDALGSALHHLAFHDSLTGLANRALFTDRLTEAYQRARHDDLAVVAMLIDLDDFKPVNDGFGHHVGDLMLREVGARLTAALRDVDTVARLGGDEFAVLLCRPRREPVTDVARWVVDALHAPCVIDGHEVRIRASVGVAVDATAGGDPVQLLRDADAAMYEIKRDGKGWYGLRDSSAVVA